VGGGNCLTEPAQEDFALLAWVLASIETKIKVQFSN